MEQVVTIFHFIAIMVLFGLLLAEFYLLRLDMTPSAIKIIARVDLGYGLASGIVIISGLARIFLGPIPPVYYGTNVQFWIKMGLFLAVGIISIKPTITFINWKKRLLTDGGLPVVAEIAKMRRFVHIELGLFVLIPVFAVLMAAA
jgi:putative membrane protein